MTLAELEQHWQEQLLEIYPERETANILRFYLEDVFSFSATVQRFKRNELLPVEWRESLDQTLERLKTGEPLQHITGFTWFDGLKMYVSPAVLIPRPETEELVDWIAQSLPQNFTGQIIDWCTGSGCIALALKHRFPNAAIAGYDWSEEALEIAATNSKALQLAVRFEQKDALLPAQTGKVEVIVSNPPYIPEKEVQLMHANVVAFEPHMALFVPDHDALLFYRAITENAINSLVPGGQLFFELHEDFADQTKALVEETGAFSNTEIKQDLQGKWRMLRAVRKEYVLGSKE